MPRLGIDQIVRTTYRSQLERGAGYRTPMLSAADIATAREKQLLMPVIVRPSENDPGLYEIIYNEQSWVIAQKAQVHEIDVEITDDLTEEEVEFRIRQELDYWTASATKINPIEQAAHILKMKKAQGMKNKEIAQFLNMSVSDVSHGLRMLKYLDDTVKGWVQNGRLKKGHGKVLASITDKRKQRELARVVMKDHLSVRQLESLVSGEPQRADDAEIQDSDADIKALATKLSEHLGSQVQLRHHAQTGSGQMVIHYSDLEVLDGVLEKMGYQAL